MIRKISFIFLIQIFLLLLTGTTAIKTISFNYVMNDHFGTSSSIFSDSQDSPPESLTMNNLADVEQPPNSIIMINGVAGEQFIPTFQPVLDSYSVLSLPFDTLVEVNPTTNEIIPTLAKQWVVTNDSKHWTFYLRENSRCHDGSIINASAVKAVFDMIIDENNPGYHSDGIPDYYSMPLDSVEILSEFVVRINFYESFSPFIRVQASKIRIPSLTSYPDIYNISQGLLPNTNGYWPIGSGPYMLQNITDEGIFFNYTFTQFQDHFRGLPPFKIIQYHLYFNQPDLINAVITQAGHTGPLLPSMVVRPEFNTSYWQVFSHPQGKDLAFLNHNRPELNNQKVRLALNYAIDKKAFLELPEFINLSILPVYYSQGFVHSFSLDNDKTSSLFPYNPTLANQLLDEAGYPRKEDGYRFSLYINGALWNDQEILFLIPYLEHIGIHCTLSILNPDWYHDFFNGNYDIYIGSISSENDLSYFAYSLFNSNGGMNPGNISDEELDYFTLLGMQTPVPQEKYYYIKKVEQRAQEYVPHILLADYDDAYVKAKSVAPYVWFDNPPGGSIYFNFTDKEITALRTIQDIEIKAQSIYFPNTNGIVSTKDQLNITTELSRELNAFISNQDQNGTFYKTTVNKKEVNYSIRCYYDFELLTESDLSLFQWDEDEEDWNEIPPIARNSSLHYIEIMVQGDVILRFGEKILEITYRYLPVITIAAGILVMIAAITIFYNNKFTNYYKGRYELE